MTKGEVWAWGRGEAGQLGNKTAKSEELPVGVKNESQYVHIAAGKDYSLAITEDFRVFGCGSLGKPAAGDKQDLKEFKRVDSITNIKNIAAGNSHAGALNGNGELYMWGNNKQCQVSAKKVAYYGKPQKVIGLAAVSVKQVSCGEGFTLCRTVDGRMYSWGVGKHGVLGHGDELPRTAPTLLTSLPFTDIVHIDAGYSSSLIVSLEGELMTFGHNADGQLGHNNKKDVLVPTPVEALSALNVVRASCSKGEKGAYSLILIDNGAVYAVGCGTLGRLGLGDSRARLVPEKIPQSYFGKEKVKDVQAGLITSFAVTHSGAAYVWGSSTQTGLMEAKRIRNFSTDRPKKLDTLPKGRAVNKLATSADHTLALLD